MDTDVLSVRWCDNKKNLRLTKARVQDQTALEKCDKFEYWYLKKIENINSNCVVICLNACVQNLMINKRAMRVSKKERMANETQWNPADDGVSSHIHTHIHKHSSFAREQSIYFYSCCALWCALPTLHLLSFFENAVFLSDFLCSCFFFSV